ncbi:MAG: LysE family transporter [Bacteroidetes bacterium]|uniref:LysE family transporter n=1 Tax=Candidatus Cryptobacteroides faecipullorum TaxID=2840764 RepID=A0A9D9I598_9BACT|nr:LysE family transporter [Candidatus Cryptobacteroides faecipullorum]
MFVDILKAFLIGICASAPIGPIAILVIQKSLSKGHKAGFVTGLGACLVDTVFSIIAIFALALAQKIIEDNKVLILLAGGLVVTVLGWRMAVSNPFRKVRGGEESRSRSISVKDFLQALAMGFSNPGAIFVIFALFAFFGMGNSSPHDWKVAPIIISVSAGAAAYWFCFTALLDHFRKRFRLKTVMWVNRITGTIIVIIGLALMGEGLFRIFFHGMPLL